MKLLLYTMVTSFVNEELWHSSNFCDEVIGNDASHQIKVHQNRIRKTSVGDIVCKYLVKCFIFRYKESRNI